MVEDNQKTITKVLLAVFCAAGLIVYMNITSDQHSVLAATHDVVINEVLFDPNGTDTGLEWIELYNPVCSTISLLGYSITASSGDYYVFGDVSIAPRDYLVLHWNADGSDSESELFTGTVVVDSNMGNSSGYVTLYSDSVRNETTIVDYVAYGSSSQPWISHAIGAGIWISDLYIPIGVSGQSLGLFQDGIDANVGSDWLVFDTPTEGSPNNVLVTPTPCVQATPTMVPTVLPTPVVSPTPTVIPTPTVTPTLVPTPTPQPLSVKLTVPSSTLFETNTPFSVEIAHGVNQESYRVKIEASFDAHVWYKATTLGKDDKFYAWNSSWDNFPSITTDRLGGAVVNGSFKIKSGDIPGNYVLRAKVKRVTDDVVITSFQETVVVSEPIPSVLTPSPSRTPDLQDQVNVLPDDQSGHTVSLRTLDTIAQLSEVTHGDVVTLSGSVVSKQGVLGTGFMYIDDGTDGILLSVPNGYTFSCDLGRVVLVTGEYKTRYGEDMLRVINADDLLCTDQIIHRVSREIESGSIGKSDEGQLVSIYGIVSETSGDVFTIDNGGSDVQVVIKESTGIDKPKMRVGYYVWAVGVVSQYNGTYRILPRFQEDVQVSSVPFSRVLGSMVLPKTAIVPIEQGWWVSLLGLGTLLMYLAALLEQVNAKRQH